MKETFEYHKPDQPTIDKIEVIREAFSELLDVIESTVPESRERSVAITHLETAAMWTNKALVFNQSKD